MPARAHRGPAARELLHADRSARAALVRDAPLSPGRPAPEPRHASALLRSSSDRARRGATPTARPRYSVATRPGVWRRPARETGGLRRHQPTHLQPFGCKLAAFESSDAVL